MSPHFSYDLFLLIYYLEKNIDKFTYCPYSIGYYKKYSDIIFTTQRSGVVKAHYSVKRAAGWCNAVQ